MCRHVFPRAGMVAFGGVVVGAVYLGYFKAGFSAMQNALSYSGQYSIMFATSTTLVAGLGPTLGALPTMSIERCPAYPTLPILAPKCRVSLAALPRAGVFHRVSNGLSR